MLFTATLPNALAREYLSLKARPAFVFEIKQGMTLLHPTSSYFLALSIAACISTALESATF